MFPVGMNRVNQSATVEETATIVTDAAISKAISFKEISFGFHLHLNFFSN